MGKRAETVEWVAGGVSALVVLALIGFFVREALGPADSLPELAVSLDPAGSGALLRYRITNSGGRAATGVAVSLTLPDGARRTVIVDEVPAHSEVTGGINLPEGAAQADLQLTVDGYVDP